jgi:hypothetical protein
MGEDGREGRNALGSDIFFAEEDKTKEGNGKN